MNKKIVTLMVILTILFIIIISQCDIEKLHDARLCKEPYYNSCTIIANKTTGIVYLSIKHVCVSTDCDNNSIDNSKCKSNRKVYFKIISKNMYKDLKKELDKVSFEEFKPHCIELKKIING